MKRLEDILKTVDIINSPDLDGLTVEGIASDSRKIEERFAFIAYKGYAQDGHDYIEAAKAKGASVIILDDESFMQREDIPYVLVRNARRAAPRIAAAFYDYPGKSLSLLAVTGTNGKTTTVQLLYDLFDKLGYPCGMISTIVNKYGGKTVPAMLTTPDPISLQALLSEMRDAGVSHVFMEASSHALDQGRLEGLDFAVAVFTNITHDHLDYHGSFAEYIKAKKILFDCLDEKAVAIVNIDDPNGLVMVQNSKAKVLSYALKRPADHKARILSSDVSGLHLNINAHEVYLRLVGEFNAYNALAVFASACSMGVDETEVLVKLSTLKGAEGRLDLVEVEEAAYTAVVDYAHTPDALEKILVTLKGIKAEEARLIVVVGCGGNRDKAKRPLMAALAEKFGDLVVLTSDNPRDEDPESILDDMMGGLKEKNTDRLLRITDRKQAIKTACLLAQKKDIVLVAGKGHEKYQEIKGQRLPFDDKEILRKTMRREDI